MQHSEQTCPPVGTNPEAPDRPKPAPPPNPPPPPPESGEQLAIQIGLGVTAALREIGSGLMAIAEGLMAHAEATNNMAEAIREGNAESADETDQGSLSFPKSLDDVG